MLSKNQGIFLFCKKLLESSKFVLFKVTWLLINNFIKYTIWIIIYLNLTSNPVYLHFIYIYNIICFHSGRYWVKWLIQCFNLSNWFSAIDWYRLIEPNPFLLIKSINQFHLVRLNDLGAIIHNDSDQMVLNWFIKQNWLIKFDSVWLLDLIILIVMVLNY